MSLSLFTAHPRLGRLSVVAVAAAAMAVPFGVAQAAPAMPSAAAVHADLSNGSAHAKYGTSNICQTHGLRCGAQVLTTAKDSATPLVTAGPSGLGPADFAAAYDITSPSTSTGTIAILDAGAYPSLESDLAAYRKQYGLPACTTASGCLTINSYTGGAPLKAQTSSQGKQIEEEVAVETSLDVDAASAGCPSCKIIELQLPYLDATSSNEGQAEKDFGTAVTTAVGKGAKAISISYGFDATADALTGATAKKFDRPGVAIEVSSGDSGFQGGGQTASWPASLTTVNAVGGTKLTKNSDGSYSESAWNEVANGHGAGGSGCETGLGAANGQPSSIAANCGGHRAETDISADADPYSGYSVYDTYVPYSHSDGGWKVIGGTSASSPLIAGYYARSGNTADVHGPNKLYAADASNFNDVTDGNNEYQDSCADDDTAQVICTAGQGWDGPTGLGTPHGLGAF